MLAVAGADFGPPWVTRPTNITLSRLGARERDAGLGVGLEAVMTEFSSRFSAESSPEPQAFDTLAVRGGEPRAHACGAVTAPIACTSTYAFANTQAIRDHFEGRAPSFEYGRYGNPTVSVAEGKLAALEGTEDALLFPSGMAAISSLLLTLLKPGDHIVLTSDCYRRTRQFVTGTLAKFGVRHSLIAPGDQAGLEAAISPEHTRVILAEAPTNPYLRVVDLARLAELKRAHRRIKLVVDSTLASPFNTAAYLSALRLHAISSLTGIVVIAGLVVAWSPGRRT